MASMTTMPLSGDWTVDDLDRLPDDGLRYELVDGVLLVSPAPPIPHQIGLMGLLTALNAAAPPELRVLPAPVDIRFSPTRQLQPDIVVIPRREPRGARPEDLPLLVVEVLSPSTRATDLTLKRRVYEEGGIPSYWLYDVDDLSLTVLELKSGRYAEARHTGTVSLLRPFPVTLELAELVR